MPNIKDYDNSNVFAQILRGELPCNKVYEDDKTLAIMDAYPVAKGHVLVIPKYNAVELSQLPDEYMLAVMKTAKKVLAAQRKVLNTHGIVCAQINGESSGQSVFHYHLHLVPTHIKNINESADVGKDEQQHLAKQLFDAISAND